MWNREGKNKDRTRKSKDKIENRQGVELLEIVEKMGLELLNGNKEGNEQGEWTFAGTLGSSVIDYAIYNAWDVIEEFKVGERTKLDHTVGINITERYNCRNGNRTRNRERRGERDRRLVRRGSSVTRKT